MFALQLKRVLLPGFTTVTALLILWFAVTTQGFFTLDNARAILASMVFVGMVSIGMTLIMVSGAFVSMALATTATISAMIFMASLSFGLPVAIALTVLVGALTGALQGVAIGGWNANPIIVTIAAAAVLEGVAVAFSHGATINPTGTSYTVLNAHLFGLPVGLYALAVLALTAESILRFTRLGPMIYLMGDNRAAARAAGLPIGRIGTAVFAIAGATASLAGIFMASFNHSASLLLNRGTLGYDAIAAVLIGGAAIGGGRGSVLNTMIGVAIIAIVSDLVLLRGFTTGEQILLKGLVMVAFAVGVHLRQEQRA
ncbi:MAG: ABC transporter permease [Mesorhizobium sp.]|nr:ABC transporter permease [Mesorhizobium sp.]MBL8577605.1 ABC transporter permease [Mesorhizobium sp.]